jgi:acetyl-CoA carboxylase biotin carboxylase subunit
MRRMRAPKKVLVANRGEIAVRVIRACHEVGARAVAVFAEADRGALHVELADEAFPIGDATAARPYLDIAKLVALAREAGCDAVHPGYGFLSENAAFAAALEEAGIAFVGPDARAMRVMGNKVSARREAIAAGVPILEGGLEPITDEGDLRRRAGEVGFPLILKAAAGGGGKGIRVVREPRELDAAFRIASSEAASAFGSGKVFVERFLENARHIEVQLLGDAEGHVIHLGERECSLQRRQQKLVEECPSPSISPALREAILRAAVALGARVRYRSAGTMEFLVEGASGPSPRFYFMEMNTRLQVEHPVTEMVTGVDLVREQLRIAAGEPLGYDQEAIAWRGHAIEARINAEDPAHDFVPSAGVVGRVAWPAGPGTRVDTALRAGDRVSLFYDPLVGKVIGWGRDRAEAVARIRRALDELRVAGIATSATLLRRLVRAPEFEAADFHIHFLEPFARQAMGGRPGDAAVLDVAIAAAVRAAERVRVAEHPERPAANGAARDGQSAWVRYGRAAQLGGFDAR